MDNKFRRGDILVIKAVKGHFSKGEAKESNSYDHARAIIQHFIYSNPRLYFENLFTVTTEILLKARERSAEGWNGVIERGFLQARQSNPLITGKMLDDDAREFEKNLINYFFAEIQHLQVQKQEMGEWVNLIDLEISQWEEEQAYKAIEKYESEHANLGA